MTLIERGRIHNGKIELEAPLPLPEGTEVILHIESVPSEQPAAGADFARLPFFGMWSDRTDMKSGASWVRRERKAWQRRANRQV